jgi:hypothetical protein
MAAIPALPAGFNWLMIEDNRSIAIVLYDRKTCEEGKTQIQETEKIKSGRGCRL